jgi:branched-chain amino acid transport system substrate-binding protein
MGIAGRDAVQLAVEQRNQAGGVAGRRVELLIRDDRQDPESAMRGVRELIAQGSEAIVGPMTSSMAAVVAPIATRAGVLVMGPTITSEALSGRDDQFFRNSATTRLYATRSAQYQLRASAMRRVAAVFDLGNQVFTENWLASFRAAFTQGGGEIVKALPFMSGGDVPHLDIARALLDARPDGILLVANSMDSALLCQQIRKLDARIPITLSDWGASERLVEMGGMAVEGVTVVQTFDRKSTAPRYQAFRRAYLDRFRREPGFAGVYAYEAAQVVLDALERREDGQSLKQVLLAMGPIQGLQGSFRFDAFGDVQRHAASISVVRDGEFVVVD